MAQKIPAIPFAGVLEAQTAATAEIVQAALNGMQRLQQLTMQAIRAGAGGQLSLAQSMGSMRAPGDVNRAAAEFAPAAEQGARYQREILQAISEMNSDVVRASYSMMERMREAITTSAGSLSMPTAMAGFPQGGETGNPMALYDSAMQQWQTALQQLMAGPAAAAAAVSSVGEASGGTSQRAATRSARSRSSARKKR